MRHHIPYTTRIGWIAILVTLCSGILPLSAQTGDDRQDRQDMTFKAVFIYHFIRYIQWPDSGSDDAFVVGFLGDTEIRHSFEEIARKRKIGSRELVARFYDRKEDLGASHILFVSRNMQGQLQEILAQIKNKPVLTIGDIEGFARQGGAVNFTYGEGQLRFEINRKAIERAGLEAGSQLLKLGILVEEEQGTKR